MIRAFAFRLVVLGAVVSVSAAAFGQASSRVAFDVASVRIGSSDKRPSQRISDARVDITNTPMRSILLTSFGLTAPTDFRLAAPGWVDQTRMDISATIPAGRSRRDIPEMLRNLLTERFGLATHPELRPMDVYELEVAKGGLQIVEVPPLDELTKELQSVAAEKKPTDSVSETIDGPVRTAMISLGVRTTTTRSRYDRTFTERRTQVIDAARMSMTDLVSVLLTTVDAPVIDKTGLTGLYQFKVELPPDATSIRRLREQGITTTVQGTPLTEPTGYSVFKALEGLGLKLERRRSPVEVVVVDRLNATPTPN